MRHFYSTNSTLKLCVKSFHKIQMRAEIYLICKNVSNLSDCIFHDFDTLGYKAENRCMQRKKLKYSINPVYPCPKQLRRLLHLPCVVGPSSNL